MYRTSKTALFFFYVLKLLFHASCQPHFYKRPNYKASEGQLKVNLARLVIIPDRDISGSRDITTRWEHFRCAVCFFWTGLWGEWAGCFCSNHPIRRICNRNLKICAADSIRHKVFSTIRWERGFLITPVPVL